MQALSLYCCLPEMTCMLPQSLAQISSDSRPLAWFLLSAAGLILQSYLNPLLAQSIPTSLLCFKVFPPVPAALIFSLLLSSSTLSPPETTVPSTVAQLTGQLLSKLSAFFPRESNSTRVSSAFSSFVLQTPRQQSACPTRTKVSHF